MSNTAYCSRISRKWWPQKLHYYGHGTILGSSLSWICSWMLMVSTRIHGYITLVTPQKVSCVRDMKWSPIKMAKTHHAATIYQAVSPIAGGQTYKDSDFLPSWKNSMRPRHCRSGNFRGISEFPPVLLLWNFEGHLRDFSLRCQGRRCWPPLTTSWLAHQIVSPK